MAVQPPNALDYRCPTCSSIVGAGLPHNCMEIGNTRLADAGVGPTTSQVTPATQLQLVAEAASVNVLKGTQIEVPYVGGGVGSQYQP